MSSSPEIRQDLIHELSWKMSPFAMADGIEILKNVTAETVEISRDLEPDVIDGREMLIRDGFVIYGAMARSNSGKGSILMGVARLFRKDEFLKEILAKKGVDLEIMAFPFAQCARAAMLPEVGIIPQGVRFAEFNVEQTREISQFQWNMMTKTAIPQEAKFKKDAVTFLKRHKKARVILFESSAPLVYPVTSKPPIEVEGFDDNGNSTFYNAALDSRTKKNSFLYLVDRDEKMQDDESTKFRRVVNTDKAKIFGEEIRVLVTLPDGREVDVSALPLEQQEQLRTVLSFSMAPPEAMRRFDKTQDDLEIELYNKDLIEFPNDQSYYEFLRKKLNERVTIVKNPYLPGTKTYDLEYLLNNPIAKAYPAILQKSV